MLNRMDHSLLDLVLVEGFKQESFPKIELHRQSLKRELMYADDDNIIAIAADEPIVLERDIPRLDLNDTESMLQFVLAYLEKS
jgi:molybdopterin-guanine dinucleotide biosynthesis protein B